MAYDEAIASRVRKVISSITEVIEKKMFGGVAFMVRGNMCCGVIGDKLMVRVGPEGHDTALAQPHARVMDFTGKPMRGFVYIEPPGFASDKDLKGWVVRAMKYVNSLPAK